MVLEGELHVEIAEAARAPYLARAPRRWHRPRRLAGREAQGKAFDEAVKEAFAEKEETNRKRYIEEMTAMQQQFNEMAGQLAAQQSQYPVAEIPFCSNALTKCPAPQPRSSKLIFFFITFFRKSTLGI